MKNFYDILGVAETASDEEIKKAYKSLALQHHPDKQGGDEEKFKEINEAYDTLKDPKKKEEYDQTRRFGAGNPFRRSAQRKPFGESFEMHIHSFDLDEMARAFRNHVNSEIFEDFNNIHKPPRSQHIVLDYHITLEEAFSGKQAITSFIVPGKAKKELKVTIPAGIENGRRIRFAGEGMQHHPNTVPGDVYITVHVKPHARFRREAQNLYSKITISALDAILGTKTEFENIDGKRIVLVIPAGTQPGDILRCRGQGFTIQGLTVRGDLFVEIAVRIPTNLTEEEKALAQKLREKRKNIKP